MNCDEARLLMSGYMKDDPGLSAGQREGKSRKCLSGRLQQHRFVGLKKQRFAHGMIEHLQRRQSLLEHSIGRQALRLARPRFPARQLRFVCQFVILLPLLVHPLI